MGIFMDQEVMKHVTCEKHHDIRQAVIRHREYTFEPDTNYILTGMRGSGKTTLLYEIAKKLVENGTDWNQIIYVNFEDERLIGFTSNDFSDLLEISSGLSDRTPYYFLDEVQNIDGWQHFARRMSDEREHVYIAGSNVMLLSKEMKDQLSGNYLTKVIMPYNFREFLTARDIPHDDEALHTSKGIGRLKQASIDLMHDGGLPESLNTSDQRMCVEDMYQRILICDIALWNNIRNPIGLRILMKNIAETVGR